MKDDASFLEEFFDNNHRRFQDFCDTINQAILECESVDLALDSLEDVFDDLADYKDYVDEKTSMVSLFSGLVDPHEIQKMNDDLNLLLESVSNIVKKYPKVLTTIQSFFSS